MCWSFQSGWKEWIFIPKGGLGPGLRGRASTGLEYLRRPLGGRGHHSSSVIGGVDNSERRNPGPVRQDFLDP